MDFAFLIKRLLTGFHPRVIPVNRIICICNILTYLYALHQETKMLTYE